MKKILLSAFACKPSSGSEWGVGWNYFIRLSKLYDVYLITEGEFKKEILLSAAEYGIDTKKIFFINLSSNARIRFVNQGNWLFYIDYRIWQAKAKRLGECLCRNNKFELVHHLNMIGFREPGSLWKLDIPFILGPIGGFGNIPDSFFLETFSVQRFKNIFKIFLNYLSLKLPYVKSAIREADVVISAYPEAQNALKKHFGRSSILIPETGCSAFQHRPGSRKNMIWVGKNVARKQFRIAAEAFLKSELSKYEKLIVIGDFSDKEIKKWSHYENIKFCGFMRQEEVLEEIAKARALLFTSVHEGNPHVIFEAMTVSTPVICHDCFGMNNLIDNSVGIKIDRVSFNFSVKRFATSIDEVVFMEFSQAAFRQKVEMHSWERRVEKLSEVYEKIIEFNEQKDSYINT